MKMSSQAQSGAEEQWEILCMRKQPSLSFCYQDILPKLTGLRARHHKAAVSFYNAFSRPGYHLFLLIKLNTQFLAADILELRQASI